MSISYARKGFTLIELLVVIAILAILAGAILTVLDPAKQRAKASQSAAKSLTKQICTNIQVCNVEQNTGTCPTTGSGAVLTFTDPKVVVGDQTGETLPAGVTITGATTTAVSYTSDLNDGKYGCIYTCQTDGNGTISAANVSATKTCIVQ